ncbi:MAG: hypothetical protein ACFB4I_17560 [Cyanophyceae cyanobacterium]
MKPRTQLVSISQLKEGDEIYLTLSPYRWQVERITPSAFTNYRFLYCSTETRTGAIQKSIEMLSLDTECWRVVPSALSNR